MLDLPLAEAGVAAEVADLPTGVEATRRRAEDGTGYLFLLNHGSAACRVTLGEPGTDLLTGTDVAEGVTLAPLGAAVVRVRPVPRTSASPSPSTPAEERA